MTLGVKVSPSNVSDTGQCPIPQVTLSQLNVAQKRQIFSSFFLVIFYTHVDLWSSYKYFKDIVNPLCTWYIDKNLFVRLELKIAF